MVKPVRDLSHTIDKPVALHAVRCERRDGDLRSMKYEPSADWESSHRLDGRDAKGVSRRASRDMLSFLAASEK